MSLIAQADEQALPGATAQAKVERVLALLGGLDAMVRPGDTVLLKPNFVAPFPQAATDLGAIAALVEAARAAGGRPLLAESAGFEFDTEGTFELLGVKAWAKEAGIPLLNLDNGPFARIATDKPYGSLEVARCALEADVVINLPKLKRHSLTRVTLGIKNLMGFLSRDSRRLLHARGLERGIVALAGIIRPQLTILDALTMTTRAVYGEAQPLGIIAGGRDLVALDCYGCHLLGEDPLRIAHIREAWRHGLGAREYQVLGGREPGKSDFRSLCEQGSPDSGSLYRLFFRAMYVADVSYARLFPGRSLVPFVHYWLGLRPHLEKRLCNRCGICAQMCPVDAVDVQGQKIVAARCMRLRCLRCVSACPQRAILVRRNVRTLER